jgi:hypothetical protein
MNDDDSDLIGEIDDIFDNLNVDHNSVINHENTGFSTNNTPCMRDIASHITNEYNASLITYTITYTLFIMHTFLKSGQTSEVLSRNPDRLLQLLENIFLVKIITMKIGTELAYDDTAKRSNALKKIGAPSQAVQKFRSYPAQNFAKGISINMRLHTK